MKIYNKIQTFTTCDFQKKQLLEMKTKKVNVSKFIREAVDEKFLRENLTLKDNRKSYTLIDLKNSLKI